MKNSILILMAIAVLFASCASTTMIQSIPSGAKVYIDEQPVGNTPYRYTDTKIVGSHTNVKLTMEGYEPYYTGFSRTEQVDVGAIIGGLFVWIPFLWTMKYNPTHTYELVPLLSNPASDEYYNNDYEYEPVKSKADKLRELKQLLDENLITKEDYEKQKKRILEED